VTAGVVTAAVDDPLLGWSLPVDDPAASARTAAGLLAGAERLHALGHQVSTMLPVQRWSGAASAAADHRLALTASVLGLERRRMLRAADALTRFSRQVGASRALADEASRLLAAARAAQEAADLADTGIAGGPPSAGWGGHRADGTLYDPHAVALLDRARERAHDARTSYDRAARRLTADLTELSGRRVVRAGLSARTVLDVAGFVPVVGDAVDAVNAAVYLAQGRWRDGLLTAAAVVPGPEGWAAGSAKIGKALDHAGEVSKVVDDVPPDVRARYVLSQLSVRGDNKTIRMLPDDESVERFYRDKLEHLGPTEVLKKDRGTESITTLPSGGTVRFRTFSDSGGYTIDVDGLPGLGFKRVHRPHD
jgi:hypothetical protein